MLHKRKKKKRLNGPSSLRAWNTDDSAVFSSKTVNQSTGISATVSQTRLILDKQKPVSGLSIKQPNGWRHPTNFRAYVLKSVSTGGFSYQARTSAGTLIRHSGDSGYLPSSSAINLGVSGSGKFPRTSISLVNQATTTALNNLVEDLANLAESLATLDRTVLSLYHLFMKAVRLLIAYKRGKLYSSGYSLTASNELKPRRRRAFRRWKGNSRPLRFGTNTNSAATSWLQFQYLWLPLANDIKVLLGLLKEDKKELLFTTSRVQLEEEHSLPKSLTGASGYFRCSGKITSGVIVRIDGEVTAPALTAFDSLGLTNPFLLGWELIPFSFLVDWLIPIGQAIQGLSASVGISFLGGSETTYTKTSLLVKHIPYPIFVDGTPISSRIESLTTFREKYNRMPFPRLYIKSPFTLTRTVTALALLRKLG